MSSSKRRSHLAGVVAAAGVAGAMGAAALIGIGQRAAHAAPAPAHRPTAGLRFEIVFPSSASSEPQSGHIMLIISKDTSDEPRFQYQVYEPNVQPGFGLDVDSLAPGKPAVIDGSVFGWPLASVNDLPAGDYRVQAVFNRYEPFHMASGHTLWLPPDKGEGQHWFSKPGNFYNAPVSVHLDPRAGQTIRLTLDKVIPPIPAPKDTKWVKYVRIQSALLSKFWGRPMYLGAIVLLPAGFDDHPSVHYPLAVDQGHFPTGFHNFDPNPPAPGVHGRDSVRAAYGYDLFKQWTGPGFPRMLVMQIQHANPYYDDSYAVNSANLGPYGDAIVQELIPYVEKKFRGIGAGWARTQFGGSTGGWESLGEQIFYPDDFNGTWTFCPDPVDFRQYETIDIYGDTSAYVFNAQWKRTPKPSGRDYLGHLLTTVERAVGHLGERVGPARQRRLSEAAVRPTDGPHRPERRPVLEGPLRPPVHPPARLEDVRPEARGQDPHLQRDDGQLAPQQRRLPDAGFSGQHQGSVLRGVGHVRRPIRALLDRRLAALARGGSDDGVPAVLARDGAPHRGDGAARRRHRGVEILTEGAVNPAGASPATG